MWFQLTAITYMCMHDCQFNFHLIFRQTTKQEISMHDCWLIDFIHIYCKIGDNIEIFVYARMTVLS